LENGLLRKPPMG
nr:RecName: Full=Alpha-N-acetylgalactosaminidase; AltName: Full=Alpha-galactosidase B [Bos indicus]